ncbi:DNA polymerase III subunit chi [Neokomagataea thailandica NBRC 106555]|uniref:DNA polymerase III subunit chi n=2 Tax=Neokomagataea TaxID=1223423 RepID=A0A4Y6V277_9PROT|nr:MULTISPECIES: DNA polymerase III subunit chi [Neokomagataea]QDH24093.1 DNA polymerase III subunit chi [Neokomagataea tanensis]GBR50355.1 DNA polymerase III subunit chi [Neokomagataea thailandica NBRC 106555]
MSSAVEIGFYHLTRATLEHVLPALLGKTLDVGERAVVCCTSTEQVSALDASLWAAKEPIWLPHGTEKTGHAEWQPIWLTAESDVPNGARFLFRIDGAGPEDLKSFTRVFDVFDGHDEQQVKRARQRWKALKSAGHKLVYWKQGERGWAKAG